MRANVACWRLPSGPVLLAFKTSEDMFLYKMANPYGKQKKCVVAFLCFPSLFRLFSPCPLAPVSISVSPSLFLPPSLPHSRSPSLSLSQSLSQSQYLSLSLSLSLSLFLPLCLPLFLSLSLWLCLCLCLCPSLSLSRPLSPGAVQGLAVLEGWIRSVVQLQSLTSRPSMQGV